jgi:Kae1-associated kinase Bud32
LKLLSEGAEAKIYMQEIFGERLVVKERIKKEYREASLDEKLRLTRTRNEARILYRAFEAGVKTPRLISVGKFSIYMSYLEGKLLRDVKKSPYLLRQAGLLLAKMHKADIAHGDFTPANIIVSKNSVYVIDFGLAEISKSIEEKAIDLLLMKRSLNEKQYKVLADSYAKAYTGSSDVFRKLVEIEKRGRYQIRTLA